MRTETKDNKTIFYLEGRISSDNAGALQKEIEQALSAAPGTDPVMDATDLEYISSAGLRVLLQLAKKQGGSLTVQNVSSAVYEIFEMTGFTDILNVRKKMREFSVEGCELVGRGAIGTVYRVDEDTIVKVYEIPDAIPMIENEQKRAKQAFLKGIPTAISYDIVKVGDKYGSVFELIKASTFNDLMVNEPEKRDELIRQYAGLMHQIHATEAEKGELPEAKTVFLSYLEQIKDVLGGELYEALHARISGMKENLHLIHGDIQMKNVMMSDGEPLLIDMDTLSTGDPVFDLMGVYLTYVQFGEDDPENTMEFLGLPQDVCANIWEKTIAYYFEGCTPEEIEDAKRRIRLISTVRFLFLLHVLKIGKPELKQIRTEHAVAFLRETVELVDSPEVGGLLKNGTT